MKRLLLLSFFLLNFIFYGCKEDPVKDTVINFYYAYQNLDFDKAKMYCNPLMRQYIQLIEQRLTDEKRVLVMKEIRKNRIEIEDIQYKENASKAVVNVKFYRHFDDKYQENKATVHLEKVRNQWKISGF